MLTVGQLKTKLADFDDNLPALIDVGGITLDDMAMTRGRLNLGDVTLGPADFGQAAVISVGE